MLSKSHTSSGIASVVLASFFWGTTGTTASYAPDVSPLAIGAFAMGGGGLLLLLTSWRQLLCDRSLLRHRMETLLLGGMAVAIYPLAFYSSMRLSGVAIGTVISIASAPFFTALLERLISKKVIGIRWMVSFLFGALGILLLTLGKQVEPQSAQAGSLHYWGMLLGLVAGLTYATYSWAARQMIERGINSGSSMAGMFGIAAVILLPSLLVTGDNLFAGATNITVALYMAVVPMFMGYLLFGYGLRHIEASTATLITLLEPAIASLFAVTILGERFSAIGWLGMALIGACLMLQVVRLPTLKQRLRRHQLQG
jgi:DME family drug/metabolite transporter